MIFCISIYKDKKENLLIVPQSYDENGICRDMAKFEKLEKPYAKLDVGESVLKNFQACIKEPRIDSKQAVNVYELAVGIKSYSKFSKDRLLVVGLFDASNGYTFSPWKRYADGSYGLDKGEEIEFKAKADANSEIIGELVMQAFEATKQLK